MWSPGGWWCRCGRLVAVCLLVGSFAVKGRSPRYVSIRDGCVRPLTSRCAGPKLCLMSGREVLVARLHVDLRRQASAICRTR
ncbi:putative leader peptide [Umezawaea sp. NPDC059074]|uniref:putative leader peptide n=1 Tax=Umezawaea sp. NPDC059074 TaxID=3346716 RepID=UPI0036A38EAF